LAQYPTVQVCIPWGRQFCFYTKTQLDRQLGIISSIEQVQLDWEYP